MAQLFQLLYGKSKKRMHPIMIDELHKCENYKKAREHTVKGWHDIVPANPGASVWRQKTATRNGNKPQMILRVNKHGQTFGTPGWIGKLGFSPHT